MVEETAPGVYKDKETGEQLERVTAKMSKSLKNVINPDEIVNTYGADSMRIAVWTVSCTLSGFCAP